MSKVLVDRELLERITALLEWDGTDETTPFQFAAKCDSLVKELTDYIAQPAEVEGVRDYLTEFAEGEVEAKTAIEELQDALSAVTAERDGLAAARMAYANEFAPDENGDPDVGNVHANIRALKAERDRLLKDAARYRWLRDLATAQDIRYPLMGQPREVDKTIDAAMAAKEA